mgnify:CR=1 FL=1
MSESKHTPGQVITTISGPVMAGYLQGHAIGSLEHNTLIAGVFSDVRGGPEVAAANAARLALCWNTHDALAFHLLAASNYIDTLGGDSQKYRAALALVEGA